MILMHPFKRIFFLFILAVFGLSIGCGIGKSASKVVKKERSADYLVRKLASSQVKAEWFSARLKVNYQGEDMSLGFSGNIRLRKDSMIWLNFKKFGFEVGRALITPDSVFVIDRINNEFIAEDLKFTQNYLHFPVNFEMLQALVLGNPVFFTQRLDSDIQQNQYRLWSEASKPKSEYLLNGNFQLTQMGFQDNTPPRWLRMYLENYQKMEGQIFSYLRKIEMDSQETGSLKADISFSNIEINVAKEIPFEIPDRYRKKS